MGEITPKPLPPENEVNDAIDPTTLDPRDPRRKFERHWNRAGQPVADAPQGRLTEGLS